MATGGEVPGRCTAGADSEDLAHTKCQPCLENGKLCEFIGMCIDCDEVLCQTCFDHHRLPKPSRHHKLIDREQMMQDNIRASTKDTCTEKCPDHDDDVIKYYCLKHCVLGCTVCITLDHKTCDDVQYIPSVAKDLANNDEYRQAEMRLTTTLDTFKTVSENVERNSAELESSCLEALTGIRDFRQKVNEAAGKIETELIKKLQAIKSKELAEIAAIGKKYKSTLDELNSSLAKITTLQNAQQHCSTYIEMMKTKDKLVELDSEIKEADVDASRVSYMKGRIRFFQNQETLNNLTQPGTFGILTSSDREYKVDTNYAGKIVSATKAQGINVKTGTDRKTCGVRGITILPNDKLVLCDYTNTTIKLVSVQSGHVRTSLKLSSAPWDITAISSNTVAVTMPHKKKITMVTVCDNTMNIDRTLDVNGSCYGIDYVNNKLALYFRNPDAIKVLSIQGALIHAISGTWINGPDYLTYDQNGTSLYVSNYNGGNVVRVNLDGTVVATYTDSKLRGPTQPLVDGSGDVLVCAADSHTIRQITNDCKNVRVLLSKSEDIPRAHAICFSEKGDKLYVGSYDSDIVQVYTIQRAA